MPWRFVLTTVVEVVFIAPTPDTSARHCSEGVSALLMSSQVSPAVAITRRTGSSAGAPVSSACADGGISTVSPGTSSSAATRMSASLRSTGPAAPRGVIVRTPVVGDEGATGAVGR